MTTPQNLSEATRRIANVIRSTKCDIIADGYIVLGQAVLAAIQEGFIPGVILSAPPCARMCEAKAVEITMASLRDGLAAAQTEADHLRFQLADATNAWAAASAQLAEASLMASVADRMLTETYDAVYSGEPADERELRWKWVTLGIKHLREDLLAANAKSEEMAGLLREASVALMPMQYANLPEIERLRASQMRARIDAALSGRVAG